MQPHQREHPAVETWSGAALREALHQAADFVADYLERVGRLPVTPNIQPGSVQAKLPPSPPEHGEPLSAMLDDYRRIIEPATTHWNHPGFLAFFANTATTAGIIGEFIAAAVNVNAMLWRTGPAQTELEALTCDWLRQMLGLPAEFHGHINDTASVSTLVALAGAREATGLDTRTRGMSGRTDLPAIRIYASTQAHSSVDKALITLGLGLDGLVRIQVDDEFRMRPDALAEAIRKDRAAGRCPAAVVATLGTTSTTSVDPVGAVAEICKREGLWLHVDAAYAGSAAICPEFRPHYAGWERADSIVFNPHKWLLTPMDCSVLLVRDLNRLSQAFSVVPDYLRSVDGVTNLMDLGVSLGRRFRSLKLWMVIRELGVAGLQAHIRQQCRLASEFANWVRQSPDFELCAPHPFSVVCFRAAGSDALNARLLEAVNRTGQVFLSSTRLRDRLALRLAIGNAGTSRKHVAEAWRLLREARASESP